MRPKRDRENLASNKIHATKPFTDSRYNNFSILVIITDDHNFASGGNGYFESAKRRFESDTSNIIYWIHYHTPIADSLGVPYMKSRSNFTEIKANQILETFWAEYKAGSPAGSARQHDFHNRGVDCPDFDFSLNWRASQKILSCFPDSTSGEYVALVTRAFGASDPCDINEYQAGFVCGLIDGALDQANFLYGVSTGIIDFARYSFVKNPKIVFSPHGSFFLLGFTSDILYRVIHKNVIESSWNISNWDLGVSSFLNSALDHISEADAFWVKINEMYGSMTDPATWEKIVNGLIESFTKWLGDVTGVNGYKEAGYTHGTMVWEIIADFLSAGTTFALKKSGELLGELIEQLQKKDLAGYAKNNFDKLPETKKVECRILGAGCFIRGTGVKSALGLVPIEKLNPFLDPPKGAMVKFATQNTLKYINK